MPARRTPGGNVEPETPANGMSAHIPNQKDLQESGPSHASTTEREEQRRIELWWQGSLEWPESSRIEARAAVVGSARLLLPRDLSTDR
jgi:hypothetical protein